MIEYDPKLFKKKRKILGLTRQQLADTCHLSRATIYNIESGRSQASSSILLIGLVLDWIADEQNKLEVFYILEHHS